MAVKIYDSNAGAFKDAPTPQIYDASVQAYKDSTGLVYDRNKGAWDERWSFVKIVPFATGTDEEIAAMYAAHYANKINLADYWNVGDVRTYHVSAMVEPCLNYTHREQDISYAIGDFDHDDLVTPINGHTKAATSLIQVDCLKNASDVLETGSTSGVIDSKGKKFNWKTCYRRTWCNEVYFAALPTSLQNIIKPVKKKTATDWSNSVIEITEDKIFIASEIEVYGTTNKTYAGEGSQYKYYDVNPANIIRKATYKDQYNIGSTRIAPFISRSAFSTANTNNYTNDIAVIMNPLGTISQDDRNYGIVANFCV